MMKQIISALCASVVLAACGGADKEKTGTGTSPSFITVEEVLRTYGLYLNRDYMAYVAAKHSCDGKPEEYRRQMADLYKQHALERQENDGDVTGVEVVRLVSCNDGRAADVYLNVSYTRNSPEEIYLQFVHDGEKWRLR